MKRPARLLLFAAVTAATLWAALAFAAKPTRHHKGHTPKPATSSTGVDASAPITSRAESAPAAPPPKARAEKDAGVVEAKTLDGGAHAFRFGEVDIEGRLRTPQLVYFLRRVRAEFAAGDLGHRSFVPELKETRKDPNF